MKKIEIAIIGAGQAGLAMGYFLQQSKCSFVILDGQKRIGQSWRDRYDSLVLFTPKQYSELPGLSFPGDPQSFPTKDEMADYLEYYANRFSLPIRLKTEVISLEKQGNEFIISTTNQTYCAQKVVVATGPFQKPYIPAAADELSPDVFQVHSSRYQNPNQLKQGNVLVVGGGNSGAQIAVELAAHKQTFLSISHPIEFLPLEWMGKSIFWYFDKLGLIQADITSIRGRWLRQQKEKVYGFELKRLLEEGKVILKPRVTAAFQGLQVVFADGTSLEVQNIIWATGFSMDFRWIHIDGLFDQANQPIHQKGVSSIPNLYFLGLPWLSCRGSALIGWVGQDAKRLLPYLIGN